MTATCSPAEVYPATAAGSTAASPSSSPISAPFPLSPDTFAAQIARSIYERRGELKLNSRDIEVLGLLLLHRTKGSPTVRPSQTRLAALACCSIKTIVRSVKRLSQAFLDGRSLVGLWFGKVAGSRYKRWVYDLSTCYALLPPKLSESAAGDGGPKSRRRATGSRTDKPENGLRSEQAHSPQNCQDGAAVGCLKEQAGPVRDEGLTEQAGHSASNPTCKEPAAPVQTGVAFGDDEEGRRKRRAAADLHQAGVVPLITAERLTEAHGAEKVEYLLSQAKRQKAKVGGGWFQAAFAGKFWPVERKRPRAATSAAPDRGPRVAAMAAPAPPPPPRPAGLRLPDSNPLKSKVRELNARPVPPRPRQQTVSGRPALALDVPPPEGDPEAAQRWQKLQAFAALEAEAQREREAAQFALEAAKARTVEVVAEQQARKRAERTSGAADQHRRKQRKRRRA